MGTGTSRNLPSKKSRVGTTDTNGNDVKTNPMMTNRTEPDGVSTQVGQNADVTGSIQVASNAEIGKMKNENQTESINRSKLLTTDCETDKKLVSIKDEHENTVEMEESNRTSAMENFEKILNKCIDFFQTKNPFELKSWATKDGERIAERMYIDCLKYKKKRISGEVRLQIASIGLEKNIPTVYLNYLNYTADNLKEIYKKNFKKPSIKKKDSILNNNGDDVTTNDSNGAEKQTEYMQEMSEGTNKDVNTQLQTDLRSAQQIVGSMVVYLLNCSDIHPESSIAYVRIGVITYTIKTLEIFHSVIEEYTEDIPFQKVKSNGRLRILTHTLSLLHNVAKTMSSSVRLHVDRILPFLKSRIQLLGMKALLVLAYLITETNNHMIVGSKEPINLLLHYTQSAIRAESHRFMGFQLSELLTGLAKLAQNDENKKLLGESGTINLVAMVFSSVKEGDPESEEELLQACSLLYLLSFCEENREMIIKEKVLVDSMKNMKESKNPSIYKTANWMNWELMGKHNRKKECVNNIDMSPDSLKGNLQDPSEAKSASNNGHIMISYQWDHQPTMLKVRDMLQEKGHRVWIDLDQMGGSTLEAMASAVEGARLILMTVSSQYKDSSNCRSEAEYGFQLKRSIIPLMMESNYTPDGWLGFIVGAKFWIDFTDPDNIKSSLDNLLKEVENRLSRQSQENENPSVDSPKTTKTTTTSGIQQKRDALKETIKNWSREDVRSWIRKIEFDHVITDDDVINNLNGNVLVQLWELKQKNIDVFYRLLKDHLHLTSLIHLFGFKEELEKLFHS